MRRRSKNIWSYVLIGIVPSKFTVHMIPQSSSTIPSTIIDWLYSFESLEFTVNHGFQTVKWIHTCTQTTYKHGLKNWIRNFQVKKYPITRSYRRVRESTVFIAHRRQASTDPVAGGGDGIDNAIAVLQPGDHIEVFNGQQAGMHCQRPRSRRAKHGDACTQRATAIQAWRPRQSYDSAKCGRNKFCCVGLGLG